MHPGPVPACAGEEHCAEGHHAGGQNHQCRQAIEHQRNTERRGPIACQVHAHAGSGTFLVAPLDQRNRNGQAQRARCEIDQQLGALVFFAQRQHQSGCQHGQQNRCQHQVRHQSLSKRQQRHQGVSCASLACAPSMWSVPVMPRDASSTTKNRAVVAKPITIAVSTKACGIGSA